MENELNYLSEKIEELQENANYYEREANRSEDVESRNHNNEMALKMNTEIELLKSILIIVTNYGKA